ncbi:MAG: putative transcriptional regulator/toxin [Candidatus Tokpelaia sp. JSC189]|nr:MAG: putative transcriptional regulator/toxin [Candidatus Tokpelaia sp. JSC189]
MGNRLKELRFERGWTHEKAADAMGVSRGQFIKLERGERRLTAQYIDLAAKAFGVRQAEILEEVIPITIPIIGRVGDSTSGEIIHDTDHGPFGEIKVPIGAFGDEVAVEVSGHSMGIYAPDGSLILYENKQLPPQESALGEVCVVGLLDGRILVKRLLRGSRRGVFDLESVVGETIHDQRVGWAAVVMQIIHPRYARRLRVDT